jgi:flavin-binding protein dodecin
MMRARATSRAARVVRVVGASTVSWSDAADKAIRMASDSLERATAEDSLAIADVGVVEYRVEVTLAFVGECAHDDL